MRGCAGDGMRGLIDQAGDDFKNQAKPEPWQ